MPTEETISFHDPEVLCMIKLAVWVGVCGCLVHAFKGYRLRTVHDQLAMCERVPV